MSKISAFKEQIWSFYKDNKRNFDWRNVNDPYQVVVSEIMLQQTQTHRVAQKYPLFIKQFPTFHSLAHAEIRDVLALWQGLGYNRRVLFLQRTAQKVVNEYSGILPACPKMLSQFDGIGSATAGSICAFAYNMPTIFIETNIRTVFIDSFFKEQDRVHDREIMPLIEATVDHKNPREWYYALMDYGVMLKKQDPDIHKKSVEYTKQTKFQGSDRQIRGAIIRLLLSSPRQSVVSICEKLGVSQERGLLIIEQLIKERLIKQKTYFLYL